MMPDPNGFYYREGGTLHRSNSPRPPFLIGDMVYCIERTWSTARYGRAFTVKDMYQRGSRWYIKINHPRFGESAYRADGFSLINPKSEENGMFIAINTENYSDIEEFLGGLDIVKIIAWEPTSKVVRDRVQGYLTENKTHKVAILKVISTAEVEPAPVRFRDFS